MDFLPEMMEKGGFFMWPILACAVFGAAIGLERLLYVYLRAGINGVLHIPGQVMARAARSGYVDGRLYDTADGMLGIAQQSALTSTIAADG